MGKSGFNYRLGYIHYPGSVPSLIYRGFSYAVSEVSSLYKVFTEHCAEHGYLY